MELTELLEKATELGAEHGRNGGSWVLDGNTSEATIAECLLMDDDGDPQWYDLFGPSSGPLSGEWADGLTPDGLLEEMGVPEPDSDAVESWADVAEQSADRDALCDAYEDAYHLAWHDEVIRTAIALGKQDA